MTVLASHSRVFYSPKVSEFLQDRIKLSFETNAFHDVVLRLKATNDWMQDNDSVESFLGTNPYQTSLFKDLRLCSPSVPSIVSQRISQHCHEEDNAFVPLLACSKIRRSLYAH